MSVEDRFAENLVRLRLRAGLSQEQLVFAAELHRTEIGQLERGNRVARIDTLVKLAGALDAKPAELLDGMVWTPGEPARGRYSVDDA